MILSHNSSYSIQQLFQTSLLWLMMHDFLSNFLHLLLISCNILIIMCSFCVGFEMALFTPVNKLLIFGKVSKCISLELLGWVVVVGYSWAALLVLMTNCWFGNTIICVSGYVFIDKWINRNIISSVLCRFLQETKISLYSQVSSPVAWLAVCLQLVWWNHEIIDDWGAGAIHINNCVITSQAVDTKDILQLGRVIIFNTSHMEW